MRLPIVRIYPALDADGYGTHDVHRAVPWGPGGVLWDALGGVLAPQRPGGEPPLSRPALLRGYVDLLPARCPP